MSDYGDDDVDAGHDSVRDAEPVYSSETPHFDALFGRYDIGNEYVSLSCSFGLVAAITARHPRSRHSRSHVVNCVSSIGTEHLGSLLLDMGFNAAPRVLDRALDDMDPSATGEISKVCTPCGAAPQQTQCTHSRFAFSCTAHVPRMVRRERRRHRVPTALADTPDERHALAAQSRER